MKFTLAWLKDHLDTEASLGDICATLDRIGIEVEEVQNPGEKLGAFVIARVVEATQHPQADRLRVCKVDAGQGVLEVVCGAPNARTGLVGVFAPIGSFIPGTGMTLERKPVRGVVSNGMLCSERELEISEDHQGIIDLPADLAKHVGKRYVDVLELEDPILHVKVTPNRPDCLSVRGIARDLAAAGLGKLKPETHGYTKSGEIEHPVPITLEFPQEAASACPVFASRYIAGVKNGPSPKWLERRLRAIGLRPISALVDITNYLTFDRGRPLHVYDADKLNGGIRARLGKAGEKFDALDNKSYVVDASNCVIADDKAVLGFGGIVGGVSSSCTAETRNVLIESAYFDPVRTAHTGRAKGIISDARTRFERGIDPHSCIAGANLAAAMVLELCGGKASKLRVAGKEPVAATVVAFDPSRVTRLGGIDIEAAEAKAILTRLGFKVDGKGDELKVTAPSWRPDVTGAADLVEEIIRIAGIDKVPAAPMPRAAGVARPVLTEGQNRVRRCRRILAGRGLVEAITWSFIKEVEARHFGGGREGLRVANPISSEMTDMRPSLLPGLMVAVQRNRDRGYADVGLFEVGQAYRGDTPEDQIMVAAGVRAGNIRMAGSGRHWAAAAASADVFDAKADAAAVLMALGLDPAKAQVTRDAPGWYHPGRSGVLRLGPKVELAHFGEVHPETLKALKVDAPLAVFEVFLSAIPAQRRKPTRAKAPLGELDLQPVRRDFAFLVRRDVAAADIIKAAQGAEKKLIAGVSVFDVFEGGKLAEEGRKSIAIEVVLQPVERTLTDTEIEAVSVRIVEAVKKATGGEIRG
jgi:phenylalanyl-tRNA synthetase beta chain